MEELDKRRLAKMYLKGVEAFKSLDSARTELLAQPHFNPDKIFEELDKTGKGYFDEEDLVRFVHECGMTFNRNQIAQLFSILDKKNQGLVRKSDFDSSLGLCGDIQANSKRSTDPKGYGQGFGKLALSEYWKKLNFEHGELKEAVRGAQTARIGSQGLFSLIDKDGRGYFSAEEVGSLAREYMDLTNTDFEIMRRVFNLPDIITKQSFDSALRSGKYKIELDKPFGYLPKPSSSRKTYNFSERKTNATNSEVTTPARNQADIQTLPLTERGDTQNAHFLSENRPNTRPTYFSSPTHSASSTHIKHHSQIPLTDIKFPDEPETSDRSSTAAHPYQRNLGDLRGKYPRFPPASLLASSGSVKSLHSRHSSASVSQKMATKDMEEFKRLASNLKEFVNDLEASVPYQPVHLVPNVDADKWLGINTPGRCEQKHVYDVKLNIELFQDPGTKYYKDCQRGGFLGKYAPCPQNYYNRIGLPGIQAEVEKEQQAAAYKKGINTNSPLVQDLRGKLLSVALIRREAVTYGKKASAALKLPIQKLHSILLGSSKGPNWEKDDFYIFQQKIGIFLDPIQSDGVFKLLDCDRDGAISTGDLAKSMNISASNHLSTSETQATRYDQLPDNFKENFGLFLISESKIYENLRAVKAGLSQLFGSLRTFSRLEIRAMLETCAEGKYLSPSDLDYVADNIQ
jgi:Ca2+-binding EF-hand superfamily protein